ncbi:MAG: adenosylcobalamin-dependent ribonucleoside-diphosphate reductase [Candidatus Bathyarchaeia archaeon]
MAPLQEQPQFEAKKVIQLSRNALEVLRARYLLKDEKGNTAETPEEMFRRVASSAVQAEFLYDQKTDIAGLEADFYKMMASLEFLPNSPTMMNAGTMLGQLSACFVLPVSDSMQRIFRAVEHMSLIQQSGGGTGFSFSSLRPRNDIVKTTMGAASGPISFMRVFDIATEVVKQGGKRRGANMGILSVYHPDIKDFITAKMDGVSFANFNLSVAVTEEFMKKVAADQEYDLINPRTREPVERLKARMVFNMIARCAWKTGDPGIVFIDEINKHNPTPNIGRIESTNPCGEQPLLPYESCNLGSINVARFAKGKNIDWQRLRDIVRLAVRFLDDVIDVNKYPLPEIEKMTRANRKIGLGIMGFADLLISLWIPYNSNEALAIAEKLMGFIDNEARCMSIELAEKRGSFRNFKGSVWERRGFVQMRNAAITTIAPTGSLSIIAGCSSGIEPLFAVVFVRNILDGTRLLEIHPLFEQVAKEYGIYDDVSVRRIAQTGSLQHLESIPREIRDVFVTAHDISPKWHVEMQAAFQRHCDNAVSKTVNLHEKATVEDVEKIFWEAFNLGCKGITVYRYGSKGQQVLEFDRDFASVNLKKDSMMRSFSAGPEYSGGCPTNQCPS